MRHWISGAAALLLVVASPCVAGAQTHGAAPTTKVIKALTVASPIRIDGTLSEPEWQQAEVISDLVQQEPRVGEPVTEKTEVRVLVTTAPTCTSASPASTAKRDGIIAREMRRDNRARRR